MVFLDVGAWQSPSSLVENLWNGFLLLPLLNDYTFCLIPNCSHKFRINVREHAPSISIINMPHELLIRSMPAGRLWILLQYPWTQLLTGSTQSLKQVCHNDRALSMVLAVFSFKFTLFLASILFAFARQRKAMCSPGRNQRDG